MTLVVRGSLEVVMPEQGPGLDLKDLRRVQADMCTPFARTEIYGAHVSDLLENGPEAVYGRMTNRVLSYCVDQYREEFIDAIDEPYLQKVISSKGGKREKEHRRKKFEDRFLAGRQVKAATRINKAPDEVWLKVAWTCMEFVLLGKRGWMDDPMSQVEANSEEKALATEIRSYLLGDTLGKPSPYFGGQAREGVDRPPTLWPSYNRYGITAPFTVPEAAGLKHWLVQKIREAKDADQEPEHCAIIITSGHHKLVLLGDDAMPLLEAIRDGAHFYMVFPAKDCAGRGGPFGNVESFCNQILGDSQEPDNATAAGENNALQRIHPIPVGVGSPKHRRIGRWGGEYLSQMHRYAYYRYGCTGPMQIRNDTARLFISRPLDEDKRLGSFSQATVPDEAQIMEGWLSEFVWPNQGLSLGNWTETAKHCGFEKNEMARVSWTNCLFKASTI